MTFGSSSCSFSIRRIGLPNIQKYVTSKMITVYQYRSFMLFRCMSGATDLYCEWLPLCLDGPAHRWRFVPLSFLV
ncbi:hypothetical protein IF2G_02995 [Cordyceps javanica]|nr:hypothetical protein IF2G_02995 [Cordyceps javanica]